MVRLLILAASLVAARAAVLPADDPPSTAQAAPDPLEPSLAKLLRWRMVGPDRGGRVAAVAGHAEQPLTWWMGACGGGVWKSHDGGGHWSCVSDGFFGGSIGAIAVAPSDPNVVYVGGGEVTVRGNWSPGHGAWKSSDGGKRWTSIGLADSQCIPRLCVDPHHENLVYAAVLGHLFGPSEMRGIYRSKDGGTTWERVLYVNPDVGACDLTLDPGNPRVLWASTWRIRRTPFSLWSGGEGSGLWRSSDGGDTWTEMTRKPGLPQGTVGIIGVTISPARPERLFAIIEADDGGVFRSDDGGESWQRVNSDRELRQRAWYYSRIYADPKDADVCYVVNVSLWRSEDGGRKFESVRAPHGDHHDLWIAPNDSNRMINGNDGGACVSFDRGASWSSIDNQPTAQLYRVTTDDHFPWRIYGAQQDNSTLRLYPFGHSVTRGGENWEITAGGESGHLAPDPRDPEIVYGGSYGGFLERFDHRTGESRSISAWPDNPIGHGAADVRYRFQWNFPLLFSRHEPGALYAAANVLFKTTDEGQSWTAISPDLTRNDPATLQASGGPITKDNTGVEVYGTLFAVAESRQESGVLWCGSDDGLLHLTRDGGAHWSDVTPKLLPARVQINSIEPHPFEKGGLYVAATAYKDDDFRPYLVKTIDFGRTWTLITGGIADDQFTRVIRADPLRRGLLFAGTEQGAYVSFDDGDHWRPLQGELQAPLPIVPITDLAIREDTLIAATQGRAFWILDELPLLREVTPGTELPPVYLAPPEPVRRFDGAVTVHFWLAEKPKEGMRVALRCFDSKGRTLATFASPAAEGERPLTADAGWTELRFAPSFADAKGFSGLVLWGGSLSGPSAPPGNYTVELSVGPVVATGAAATAGTTGTSAAVVRQAPLELRLDSRLRCGAADLAERFEFLLDCRDLLTRTHESIERIRELRDQLATLSRRLAKREECAAIVKSAGELATRMTVIEEVLYQTKLQSGQDPLNFPIRLNNKLAALASDVASNQQRPTAQAKSFRAEVGAAIEAELAKLAEIVDKELPALNRATIELKVPAIFVQQ